MTQAVTDLDFIQWMQLADAVAWAFAVLVFSPSLIALWRRRDTLHDLMAPPIILIGINRIWAEAAWLWFPHEMPIHNELFLRAFVCIFSVICAVAVTIAFCRSSPRAVP